MQLDKKKFFKNSIYVYIGEVISKAILFLFNAIIARQLGVVDFGVFTYAYSIGLVIISIIDFGTNNLILKKFSEKKGLNDNLLTRVLNLQISFSIICIVSMIISLMLFKNSLKINAVIIILLISLLFENVTSIYRSVFKASEKFDFDMCINVSSSVLRIILSLCLYYFISSIFSICIGIVISTLIVLIIAVAFYNKIKSETLIDKKVGLMEYTSIISLVKQCYNYAVPSIIKSFYIRIDSIFIKLFVSEVELGLYNSSLKILFTLHFIPLSLIQVLFPTFNKLFYEKQQNEINSIFPKIYLLFFIGINSLQMLLVIFSNFFIQIIYGSHYLMSENIFKLVITSLVFTSLTALLNYIFIANNNVSITNKYFIYSTIIKVTLTITLSYYFSAIGAAYAFLISEIFQFQFFLSGSFKYNLKKRMDYYSIFVLVVFVDIVVLYAGLSSFVNLIILAFSSYVILCLNKINIFRMVKTFFSKELS